MDSSATSSPYNTVRPFLLFGIILWISGEFFESVLFKSCSTSTMISSGYGMKSMRLDGSSADVRRVEKAQSMWCIAELMGNQLT